MHSLPGVALAVRHSGALTAFERAGRPLVWVTAENGCSTRDGRRERGRRSAAADGARRAAQLQRTVGSDTPLCHRDGWPSCGPATAGRAPKVPPDAPLIANLLPDERQPSEVQCRPERSGPWRTIVGGKLLLEVRVGRGQLIPQVRSNSLRLGPPRSLRGVPVCVLPGDDGHRTGTRLPPRRHRIAQDGGFDGLNGLPNDWCSSRLEAPRTDGPTTRQGLPATTSWPLRGRLERQHLPARCGQARPRADSSGSSTRSVPHDA